MQHSDDDESVLSPVESCASALQEQEELRQLCEITSHLECVLTISFLVPFHTLQNSKTVFKALAVFFIGSLRMRRNVFIS